MGEDFFMQNIFLVLFYINSFMCFKASSFILNSNTKNDTSKHLAAAFNTLITYLIINITGFVGWYLYVTLIILFVIETHNIFKGHISAKAISGTYFVFNFTAVHILVHNLHFNFTGTTDTQLELLISIILMTIIHIKSYIQTNHDQQEMSQVFQQNNELFVSYGVIHFSALICLIVSSIIFKETIIGWIFLIGSVITIYNGVRLITNCNQINNNRYNLALKLETLEMYQKLLTGRSLTVIEVDLNENKITYFKHDKLCMVEFIGDTYSNFMDTQIFAKIHQLDNARSSQRLSTNYMRTVYENGIDSYEIDYRIKNCGESYMWVRSIVLIHQKILDNRYTAVINIIDINNEKEKENNLLNLAQRDTFTGLYNKLTATKLITSHLEAIQTGILFIIDLDNFKNVNDKISHSMGDIAIKESADKIASVFEPTDTVSRFGGDEFIVFTPSTPETLDIDEKCNRLGALIDTVYTGEGAEVRISASIGVAIVTEETNTYETLFEAADQAVYTSKNNGKNTYTVANR